MRYQEGIVNNNLTSVLLLWVIANTFYTEFGVLQMVPIVAAAMGWQFASRREFSRAIGCAVLAVVALWMFGLPGGS